MMQNRRFQVLTINDRIPSGLEFKHLWTAEPTHLPFHFLVPMFLCVSLICPWCPSLTSLSIVSVHLWSYPKQKVVSGYFLFGSQIQRKIHGAAKRNENGRLSLTETWKSLIFVLRITHSSAGSVRSIFSWRSPYLVVGNPLRRSIGNINQTTTIITIILHFQVKCVVFPESPALHAVYDSVNPHLVFYQYLQ
jgi:hypothetical protein